MSVMTLLHAIIFFTIFHYFFHYDTYNHFDTIIFFIIFALWQSKKYYNCNITHYSHYFSYSFQLWHRICTQIMQVSLHKSLIYAQRNESRVARKTGRASGSTGRCAWRIETKKKGCCTTIIPIIFSIVNIISMVCTGLMWR